MSEKKWHNSKEMRELQKEWYGKLEDEGFYDIEGKVEGPFLKGPTPSIRLGFLKGQIGRSSWYRKTDEVLDESDQLIDYTNNSKARYFHFAMLITSQAFRDLEDPEMCVVWAFHSQGYGERVIASEVEIPRGRVRKYIKVLQNSIDPMLDSRVKECNDVIDIEEEE